VYFFDWKEGIEGRVSENAPGEHFPAPPLRPQAGDSFCPCQNPPETLRFRRVFFFVLIPELV